MNLHNTILLLSRYRRWRSMSLNFSTGWPGSHGHRSGSWRLHGCMVALEMQIYYIYHVSQCLHVSVCMQFECMHDRTCTIINWVTRTRFTVLSVSSVETAIIILIMLNVDLPFSWLPFSFTILPFIHQSSIRGRRPGIEANLRHALMVNGVIHR